VGYSDDMHVGGIENSRRSDGIIDVARPPSEREALFVEKFYSSRDVVDRLIIELKKPKKAYDLIECMLKKLEVENQYKEGLVFDASEISIEREMNNFCFYGMFYQYDYYGEQELVHLISKGASCLIGLHNGKLFKNMKYRKKNETILLKEKLMYSNKLSLGMHVRNGTVLFHLNDVEYRASIGGGCTKLTIGKNFKGIITRLLWYENIAFNMKYLSSEKSRSEYYVDCLVDLEKLLIFKNQKGVYIDSLKPYFFSLSPFEVRIVNIFQNMNLYWLENGVLRTILLGEILEDVKVKKILERFITKALLKP
jgi:hypothetical protein